MALTALVQHNTWYILNNILKKVLVSSTQQRIFLTLLVIRPVSCDYYTFRQGLDKIVWGTYFVP